MPEVTVRAFVSKPHLGVIETQVRRTRRAEVRQEIEAQVRERYPDQRRVSIGDIEIFANPKHSNFRHRRKDGQRKPCAHAGRMN